MQYSLGSGHIQIIGSFLKLSWLQNSPRCHYQKVSQNYFMEKSTAVTQPWTYGSGSGTG